MNSAANEWLSPYEDFVAQSDEAFLRVQREYSGFVRCGVGCNDCCFAVFELHPVEAVHLKGAFERGLQGDLRREAVRRAVLSREKLQAAEREIGGAALPWDSPERMVALSRLKIECPLHDQGRCVLYEHRPITCRTYGIPRSIKGKGATCGRSGFERGISYPTLNMDILDRRLHGLSRTMLSLEANIDIGENRMLVSVAEAILEDLSPRYFQCRAGA